MISENVFMCHDHDTELYLHDYATLYLNRNFIRISQKKQVQCAAPQLMLYFLIFLGFILQHLDSIHL